MYEHYRRLRQESSSGDASPTKYAVAIPRTAVAPGTKYYEPVPPHVHGVFKNAGFNGSHADVYTQGDNDYTVDLDDLGSARGLLSSLQRSGLKASLTHISGEDGLDVGDIEGDYWE